MCFISKLNLKPKLYWPFKSIKSISILYSRKLSLRSSSVRRENFYWIILKITLKVFYRNRNHLQSKYQVFPFILVFQKEMYNENVQKRRGGGRWVGKRTWFIHFCFKCFFFIYLKYTYKILHVQANPIFSSAFCLCYMHVHAVKGPIHILAMYTHVNSSLEGVLHCNCL